VALIVTAFTFGGQASPQQTTTLLPTGLALASAVVLSLQAVIYTYDGWAAAVYFSEEVEDPDRNIPRSLFAGVLTVIAIYLLVNLSLLYVLPVQTMAAEDFAAGAAAEVLFGPYGVSVFRILMILSLLSGINAYHLMACRVLFAMSRDGLLSKRAETVNAGGTPTVALLLSTLVAVIFILFGRTFEKVITVLAFFFVANYTLSFTSVFVLRWREPAKTRPYRAWGYPWTTALALLGSIAFLLGAVAGDTRNSVYALLLLAASYPTFRMVRSLAGS
jgi:APA family basic amino acid/polyamine antiporter